MAAQPAIGVLGAAFLPGAVRITEPCGSGKGFVAKELRAPIEGDAAASIRWKCVEHGRDARDDRVGALVVIGNQDQKPALAFLQRREISATSAAREDHQIGFPVAELLAASDMNWPCGDAAFGGNNRGPRLAIEPPPALTMRHGKQAIQCVLAAAVAVNMSVDRLVRQDRKSVV